MMRKRSNMGDVSMLIQEGACKISVQNITGPGKMRGRGGIRTPVMYGLIDPHARTSSFQQVPCFQ